MGLLTPPDSPSVSPRLQQPGTLPPVAELPPSAQQLSKQASGSGGALSGSEGSCIELQTQPASEAAIHRCCTYCPSGPGHMHSCNGLSKRMHAVLEQQSKTCPSGAATWLSGLAVDGRRQSQVGHSLPSAHVLARRAASVGGDALLPAPPVQGAHVAHSHSRGAALSPPLSYNDMIHMPGSKYR